MLGPYSANLHDSEILKIILQDPNGLCELYAENDFVVLDRGFRDMKDKLGLEKINILMYAFKGKRKQLTRRESNDSCYVTKIRWAFEALHGILKQKYRLLDHKLDNKLLPNIGTYLRIASFLNNEFGKRLQSDTEFSSETTETMKARKYVKNTFPEMTERDLKILFTGTYQLSQAVSCLAEIINKDGHIRLQYV